MSKIVLKAGTYEFDDAMCTDQGGSALCIDHPVTIEAEVAGAVVLDAQEVNRVLHITAGTRVELVGLNITGGDAGTVRSPDANHPRVLSMVLAFWALSIIPL